MSPRSLSFPVAVNIATYAGTAFDQVDRLFPVVVTDPHELHELLAVLSDTATYVQGELLSASGPSPVCFIYNPYPSHLSDWEFYDDATDEPLELEGF